MSRLIQRHDQFFKRLLDQPGAAGALLRERLPSEVAAMLDDRPPEHIPGSFVPAELREYRTDRLYRTRTTTGRPLLIHTVVEHKSAPDPRIGLQLLGYKTRVLEYWERTEGQAPATSLPAVMSIVVYHGKTEWRVPLTLAGAVDADPVLHPWLTDFRYTLVDLGHIEDAQLSQSEVLRVGFLILKYGSREGDLRETLLALGQAALALGFDDLVALVRYILFEPNEVEAGILREVLREIMPGQEERIMSIAAEQLKAEAFSLGMAQGVAQGVAQGEARGEAKGKADILLRLLRRRFPEVPPDIEDRVRAAGSDLLDEWSERILDARTLADVFGAQPH